MSVGCQNDLPEVTSAAGATNVTKTAAAPSAKPNTNNKATPTASKILANDAKQDAKQAKNNTTQFKNIKDKKKETTNKPPIAAKPTIAEKPIKEKKGTHTTVKPRTNKVGCKRAWMIPYLYIIGLNPWTVHMRQIAAIARYSYLPTPSLHSKHI